MGEGAVDGLAGDRGDLRLFGPIVKEEARCHQERSGS